MLIDLTDTTTSEVRAALTRARDQMGGPTTGVVLIRSGDGAPGQTVLMRLYGPMSLHPDSVVMPLLVADTPVVTWWPGNSPEAPASEPLGALAQRRITDAAAGTDPAAVLQVLASAYRPGDTDLSWTRATAWRSLLAATVDQTDTAIHGGVVQAEDDNPTAELLTAWLASRLGVPFSREVSGGPGITQVRFAVDGGDITVSRSDGRLATLSKPGQPDRHVALHRRDTADLLAEELRRLNPDEVYGETLAATTVGLGV
jgi:glucose-6-phosphate dehydrogenase assembly protein OpcA